MNPSTEQTPAREQVRGELDLLITESVNEAYRDLDTWSTTDLVRAMNAEDQQVPQAVAAAEVEIAAAVDGVAERIANGGRLLYVGAGTPGRLGVLDASEIPPTFGVSPDLVVGVIAGGTVAIQHAVENAEDRADQGAADLEALGVGPKDAVVGIAASGRTPYVLGALQYAREAGAFTVAVSSNPGSTASSVAEVGIEVVVGPEFITGSTRLKAGTAQKLVLNMISTLAMIRLGKTYGNLMVDLQATNDKLRSRALRTVMLATGASAEVARTTLDTVQGSVKEAILVIKTGLAPAEARDLLARHGGRLRAAEQHAQA
ncbi:N-acetylmuramic acid 6-phosphate etherase [Microlunatus panaciterrae]|uniref:N-acetylmuramic acid 6-phosphate etherase n=1 Tax=Microlunatus panaciterrae TaxID=400768 RepID=A0ABS2RIX3_9ACTN|nr:N-acetylmuramic acid 6-phosphate etherase [Microlunatus panaciterrae]